MSYLNPHVADLRGLTMRDTMSRAMTMWFRLKADERSAIRFGSFPAKPVKAAVADGHDEIELCAALAEIARRNCGE
jgi:mono/diheme cytochrome c family protein